MLDFFKANLFAIAIVGGGFWGLLALWAWSVVRAATTYDRFMEQHDGE